MVSIPNVKPITNTDSQPTDTINHAFLKFLSAIRAHAAVQFGHLRNVDREEAFAEATTWAYCIFRSVVRRGEGDKVTPSTIARYGVLSAKNGKHVSTGQESVNDVLSPRTRRIRGFLAVGLAWDDDRINCLKKSQPEVWRLRLKHDRRTPVLDQVAFRLNWSLFLSRQSDRTRRIIALLAAGHRRREVAERFGVTESTVPTVEPGLADVGAVSGQYGICWIQEKVPEFHKLIRTH